MHHPRAFLLSALLAGILGACVDQSEVRDSDVGERVGNTTRGTTSADALLIVDCLLPAQVRTLSSTTYRSARRPVQTTAQDCEIRGGEYVAYNLSLIHI